MGQKFVLTNGDARHNDLLGNGHLCMKMYTQM